MGSCTEQKRELGLRVKTGSSQTTVSCRTNLYFILNTSIVRL